MLLFLIYFPSFFICLLCLSLELPQSIDVSPRLIFFVVVSFIAAKCHIFKYK